MDRRSEEDTPKDKPRVLSDIATEPKGPFNASPVLPEDIPTRRDQPLSEAEHDEEKEQGA